MAGEASGAAKPFDSKAVLARMRATRESNTIRSRIKYARDCCDGARNPGMT